LCASRLAIPNRRPRVVKAPCPTAAPPPVPMNGDGSPDSKAPPAPRATEPNLLAAQVLHLR